MSVLDEYTPTTELVRRGYPRSYYKSMIAQNAEFDRWLAGVKADAWDKGALWAAVECGAIADKGAAWLSPGDNPYRDVTR